MSGLSESRIFSCLVNAAKAIHPFNDLLTGDFEDDDEDEGPVSPEGIAAEKAQRYLELAAKHQDELSSGSGEWARRARAYLSARCWALRGELQAAAQDYREYTSWYTGEDSERAAGVTMAVGMEFDNVDLPRDLKFAMRPTNSLHMVAQHLRRVGEIEDAIQLMSWLLSRADDLCMGDGFRNEVPKIIEKWEAEKAKSKGCFIATAVYGSPSEPAVLFLRAFRDDVLLRHATGRLAVATYYRLSPPLARCVARSGVLRAFARWTVVAPAILFARIIRTAARREFVR